MRELTDHKLNGLNDALSVKVLDEPGSGGACHHYQIHADESRTTLGDGVTVCIDIRFQDGPIGEAGVNGLSNEALLAVVIDRLRGFQGGNFACRDNAVALTKLEESLMWLQRRTRERTARGVEGTHAR